MDKAANNRFLHPTLNFHKIDTAPKLAGMGGVGLAPESPSYRECRQSKILQKDNQQCLGMVCHICMPHRTNFGSVNQRETLDICMLQTGKV